MKYFISYTLKDFCINKEILLKIKKFYSDKNIETYIDILDNVYLNSPNYFSKSILINERTNNSLINPCQKYLQNQLILCDRLIILLSPFIFKSKWVKEEILLATRYQIPISYVFYSCS